MPRLPYLNLRALSCPGLVLLGLAAATMGCGTKAPAVTGLFVTVSFSGVHVEQLALSVSTPAGVALPPKRRPEQVGTALASPQSVTIYLPDALAEQVATCTVTAYVGDRVTATGSGTATLVLNQLVPVPIELNAAVGDGAAPDAGDANDGGDAMDGAEDGPPPDAATSSDALKGNGVPCTGNDQCDSTVCVDGVCCATGCTGLCEACNLPTKMGTCSPEPAGTAAAGGCANQGMSTCGFDGTCDGSGKCRRYQAGAECKPQTCNGALYVPAAACDGLGACVTPANVDCTPYVCDMTGGPPACRTTCRAGGTDCKAPAQCVANSCGAKVKKPDGSGCVDGTDCVSTHCVDGVCCGAACTSSCTSCNQVGKEGMCLPVALGVADPHKVCVDQGATTCGRNGLCDGVGGCQQYPATAICASASCNGRQARPERHCDGKGVCVAVADVDCQPYRCDPMTAACFKSCMDNTQCSSAPKRTCNPAMMICQ